MPIKFKATKVTPAPQPDAPLETINAKITEFPQNFVMYHYHKNTARPTKARHHNVIHSSDLDPGRNWCPREPALLTLHNKKRPNGFISAAQQTVFDFGHKGSDIVRERLPPEMVWGNWRCRNCGHSEKHTYTPKSCSGCGAKGSIDYREVFGRCPETGVVGSFDLCVDVLMNGKPVIVETKTEGNADFKSRSAPTFDHEWRTKLYLRLAAVTPWLQGKLNTTAARIVYISKEGHAEDARIKKWGLPDAASSALKEYIVPRDDSALDNRLQLVKSYRLWRKHHDADPNNNPVTMPDRICNTKNDTRAAACSVCKECFG